MFRCSTSITFGDIFLIFGQWTKLPWPYYIIFVGQNATRYILYHAPTIKAICLHWDPPSTMPLQAPCLNKTWQCCTYTLSYTAIENCIRMVRGMNLCHCEWCMWDVHCGPVLRTVLWKYLDSNRFSIHDDKLSKSKATVHKRARN